MSYRVCIWYRLAVIKEAPNSPHRPSWNYWIHEAVHIYIPEMPFRVGSTIIFFFFFENDLKFLNVHMGSSGIDFV